MIHATTSDLVRAALKTQTLDQLAERLGCEQSTISKYKKPSGTEMSYRRAAIVLTYLEERLCPTSPSM